MKFGSRVLHPGSRKEDKVLEPIYNDQTPLWEQGMGILVTVEVHVHRDEDQARPALWPPSCYDLIPPKTFHPQVHISVEVSVQHDDTLPENQDESLNVHPTARRTITTKIWAGNQDPNSTSTNTPHEQGISDSEETPTEEWVVLDVGTDLGELTNCN